MLKKYKKIRRGKKNDTCPFCWGLGFVVDDDGYTSICPGCLGTGHQK